MSLVKPFAALRPRPHLAPSICELPYDVFSTEEAQGIAANNPMSFFHVSKPEIDLAAGESPNARKLCAMAASRFARLIAQAALGRDAAPCFYLYRQMRGPHRQTGIVGGASCQEYLDNRICRHELTRPDKEDDRMRHIEALNAQTGPALLFHAALPALDGFVRDCSSRPPHTDFTAVDGVRHSTWVVAEPEAIRFIADQFAGIERLYIADGHHRTAAAARVCAARSGRGGSDAFLAVIFPHDQLQILPYHRLLNDLNGHSPAAILDRLSRISVVSPESGFPPSRPGEMALYLAGRWHRLRFQAAARCGPDSVESLDVTRLQREILEPVFGIANPRTSDRIEFVGGIRGTAELERRVDSGSAACAFALAPTRIDDLMAVVDSGAIMPPKSTWFEPKLRDGLFCHLLA